jgi:hypothetical protein
MRYKPKGIAALHIALGGLPDKMRVVRIPGWGGFDARRRSFLPNMISSAERLARRRGIDGTRVRGIMLTCAAPRPWKAPPQ